VPTGVQSLPFEVPQRRRMRRRRRAMGCDKIS